MAVRGVERYFTSEGVLRSWPSRRSRNTQVAALGRVCESFERGRDYDEPSVNAIIQSRIAFEDYVLIRRELIDEGLLRRSRDCRRYWRP